MNAALILVAMAAAVNPDLHSVLDELRMNQQVPGVSAVITRRSEVLFEGASGMADLETGRRMTPDTILYAGSLTKIMTAVLTLQLAQEGNLSLDDTIDGIAADSPESGSGVNVRQLLTHSSGLDREGNFGYWFSADFPDEAALSQYLLGTELRTPPGTEFHYSNIGYAALLPVIERASKQGYHDALLTRVFQPLGMVSSGSPGPVPRIAAGYSPRNRVIPNDRRPFAGLGRQVGERNVREYHDANAMTPAFGAYSTARDLGLLARFLLGYGGEDVLNQDMRAQMLTSKASGWGLGIRIGKLNGRDVARHSGWFAAHRSHMLLDLQSGIAVVVMANGDGASPGKMAEALIGPILEIEKSAESKNR